MIADSFVKIKSISIFILTVFTVTTVSFIFPVNKENSICNPHFIKFFYEIFLYQKTKEKLIIAEKSAVWS